MYSNDIYLVIIVKDILLQWCQNYNCNNFWRKKKRKQKKRKNKKKENCEMKKQHLFIFIMLAKISFNEPLSPDFSSLFSSSSDTEGLSSLAACNIIFT